jgi:hypothetical protein
MKCKMTLIAVLAVVLGSGMIWFMPHNVMAQTNAPSADRKILYYTCPMHPQVKSDVPGACHICGMGLVPVYGSDITTNDAAATKSAVVPYPLKMCLVSGEALGGDMGPPVVFIYTKSGVNQELKFCCPMCKPRFLQAPDKYIKKLHEAEAALTK